MPSMVDAFDLEPLMPADRVVFHTYRLHRGNWRHGGKRGSGEACHSTQIRFYNIAENTSFAGHGGAIGR